MTKRILTEEERDLGMQDVKCIHGNIHYVQTISPLLNNPYDCHGLCLKSIKSEED